MAGPTKTHPSPSKALLQNHPSFPRTRESRGKTELPIPKVPASQGAGSVAVRPMISDEAGERYPLDEQGVRLRKVSFDRACTELAKALNTKDGRILRPTLTRGARPSTGSGRTGV